MSTEMVLHVALWLIAAFGSFIVAQQKYELHKLRSMLEVMQREYMRRDDACDRMDHLKDLVIEMRDRLNRIDEKLDRKADKQGFL
ncbi:hypothetical protein M942_04565 [Enterobacter ludwigii]|jgi:hypothetical protein|uniref:hypothetical protein n=1 Tax=Enterobacter TaxID=547 RepID=UPI0003D93EB9|nr:hypothetical protein [Enterobacter ludwigii]AHE72562.1 hypothetical protein M942_04565 [Enterobacter ludwigii]